MWVVYHQPSDDQIPWVEMQKIQSITTIKGDFSLDTFERLVYSRSYVTATTMLLHILREMEIKGLNLSPKNGEGNEDVYSKYALTTRLVGCINLMFCDPEFELNESVFLQFLSYKRYLVALFSTTSFSNMNHIIGLAGRDVGNGQLEFQSQSSYLKLLLASSIYSQHAFVLQTLNDAPKRFKLPYWLSLLDTECVLDSNAEQFRNRLLLEGESMQNEIASSSSQIRIANLWMTVSYFTTPTKHDVKKYLNRILLKAIGKNGVTQPTISPRKSGTGKTKLLVLSEMLLSYHAMYRCYGPLISQLRSKFHTVLVAATGTYDDTSKSLFDEIIDFKANDPIKKIVGKIIKADADVIYYPSIGMQAWTINTCQLRLAPVQMMSLGHPATSNSDVMDYILIEEPAIGDPQCFSEKVVVTNGGVTHSPYDDEELPTPVIRERPKTIKIAIPAILYKLNSDFLRVCKNIEERVERPIEFHFFPNRTGFMLDFVTTMIKPSLPNSIVHPSMSYQGYMKLLAACDIHFSTFPFGMANGCVDSTLAALPIVALDGPEAHSHVDCAFQKALGVPEWLSANTTGEYEEAAIRLIEDDDLRVSISKDLVNADAYNIFANHHDNTEYFPNLVHWIYRNHEAIQSTDQKTWTEKDFI